MSANGQGYKTISIDGPTFNSGVDPNNSSGNTVSGDVTLDQVHDEVFLSMKRKPSKWEDNILENTKDNPLPSGIPILDVINTYGKCVVLNNPKFTNETNKGNSQIPYTIPDNNEVCYIRDCFSGVGIPGLNNIFDQANMSLKSFVDYHTSEVNSSKIFASPLLGNGLYKQNTPSTNLKYTAYFNYDLLIFKYIYEKIYPMQQDTNDNIKTLYYTVNLIVDGRTDIPLSFDQIEAINVVNINYLWCKLMIYCYQRIDDDQYLKVNIAQYTEGISRLCQIRFDSFVTKDNYFTNPMFSFRGNGSAKDVTKYIDGLCNAAYSAYAANGEMWQQRDNKLLPFGVQYVTTQSMVAQGMKNALGKKVSITYKGIIARNENNKDEIKNNCMRVIDGLFNHYYKVPQINKMIPINQAQAWSMIKFSGDSSHIVFGQIMEDIKIAYNIPKTPPLYGFKIVYLLEERPLTARLLANKKNIFVEGTNLIMEKFTGPGSENKYDRHACLYVDFNLSITLKNIIEGLEAKIMKYNTNQKSYEYTKKYIEKIRLPIDLFEGISYTIQDGKIVLNQNNIPTGENLNSAFINGLQDKIKEWEFIQMFEIDEMFIQLNKLAVNYDNNSNPASIKILKEVLIGGRPNRVTSSTNWRLLLRILIDTDSAALDTSLRNINTSSQNINVSTLTQSGYYEMKLILSLIIGLLNIKFTNDTSVYFKGKIRDQFNRFYTNSNFQSIYNKIIYSFTGNDAIRSVFSISNQNKYETFIQTRIVEWSDNNIEKRVPPKVEIIVNSLKEFVDSCLYINSFKLLTISGGDGSPQNKIKNSSDNSSNHNTNSYSTIINEDNVLLDEYQDNMDVMLYNNPHEKLDHISIAIEVLNYISQTPIEEQNDVFELSLKRDYKSAVSDMAIESDTVKDLYAENYIRKIINSNIFQVFSEIIMRESANYITYISAIRYNINTMKEIYQRYNDNVLKNFNVNLLKAIQKSFHIKGLTETNSYIDSIIKIYLDGQKDNDSTYNIIHLITYIIKNYNNIYSKLGSSPSNISENITTIDYFILKKILYGSQNKNSNTIKKRGRSNSSTTDSTKNQSKRQRMKGYRSNSNTKKKRGRNIRDSTKNHSMRQRMNGDVYYSQ